MADINITRGGPDLFGPFQEALGLATKLTISQRQLDQQKANADRLFMQGQQKLLADAMNAQNEFAFKSATEIFKKATESYDPNDPQSAIVLKSALTNMEKIAGIPLVPRDEAGEPVLPGVKFRSTKENNPIQVDQGNKKVLIYPDGRREEYPVQPNPNTVFRIENKPETKVKPPAGYEYDETGGSLRPIKGGPADPSNPKNQPKVPSGYRLAEDGETLEPIPGGPRDPSGNQGRPLPATMVEDLNGIGEVLKAIEETENLYLYGKKTKPENATPTKPGEKWVGMFDNKKGWITGKTGIMADPNEQLFRANLQKSFNIQGKLRAGSAWTAPEIERLMQELPSANESEVAFEQKLDLAKRTLMAKREQIIANAKESGYRTPSSQGAPASGEAPKTAEDYLKKFAQ